MNYLITFEGDIVDKYPLPKAFNSLDDALEYLSEQFQIKNREKFRFFPDPEDDRILIYEIDPPEVRIVWHFTGYHYPWPLKNGIGFNDNGDPKAETLNQGKLPGHPKESLYEMAMY